VLEPSVVVGDLKHRLADVRYVDSLRYGCMEVLVTIIKLSSFDTCQLTDHGYPEYEKVSITEVESNTMQVTS
jgi:hypothetical protein